jgi:hypothetical protein
VNSDPAALTAVGLRPGEPVRWRRRDGGHWQSGVVLGRESDGSVAVRDKDGGTRSIVASRLEAKRPDRRGRLRWQQVEATAAQSQLSLWEPQAPGNGAARPRSPRGRTIPLRPPLRAR